MEHFEILDFRTRGSGFQLSLQDVELLIEKNFRLLLKFAMSIYHLINIMDKTHKYFRK
jgi:hypothetical protein